MSNHHPDREEILRRLQQPGAPSVPTMAEETGIPKATLYYWLSRNTPAGGHDSPSQQGSPGMNKRRKSRTPSTKLRFVAESMTLKGDALRTWCKEHGVTVDELLSWRDLALSGIEESTGARSGVSRSELETHFGELEKEIWRKNDALAEATALLVLQKKTKKLFSEEK
jgi:transposase